MSKVLRTAAVVVGAVALVATGVGAFAVAGSAVAGIAGSVATYAGLAAGVLSTAAQLTAKKPTAQATGSQTSFSADPDAGIPLVVGRTGTAGNIVFRKGFDTSAAGDNDRQSFVSVLSLGPVKSVGGFTADRAPVNFSAGAALGAFAGFMWMTTQLGAMPEASAMGFGSGAGTPPGWTAAHKLSGKAAATWTLRFDTKAKMYQNGVPAPMWAVEGGFRYDPRKDSTYPGGSGPHRIADPSDKAAYDAAVATWEYTENPYLHALGWALGHWQRDTSNPASEWQRVMGMGSPVEAVDMAAFVEGANIADANGWKVGGVIYSGDDKWESLKKILQAGMGEPLALGAKVSCLVNAPKVSLATITTDDVVGAASVAATQPRRNRINTVTPRYRLEANNWQHLPGPPISVATHVAEDKGKRSKVLDYWFIQGTDQVATAVRYDIENAREFGPITLPLKLFWMGYKPGDCVTAELPELGLNGQPILLLNREIEPTGGIVTMTARSETPAKHAFALGQTTTPPTTPGVSGPPVVPVPGELAWEIAATKLASGDGGAELPALVIEGAADAGSAEAVVFEYRAYAEGQASDAAWIAAGVEPASATRKEIVSLVAGKAYEAAISYRVRGVVGARRILGPVIVGDLVAGGFTGEEALRQLLAGKSRLWWQPTPPSAAESGPYDYWLNTAEGNKIYARSGSGLLAIGGKVLTFDGVPIGVSPWRPVDDQRIAEALLEAIGAKGLAATKNRTFLQPVEPEPQAIGDKWYNPVTGIEQRWNGTAWEATTDKTALAQHTMPQIPDVRVGATYTGAIKQGQLPQSRFAQHLVGGADVSPDALVTASATGGVAITVNNVPGGDERGMITLNVQGSLPAEATVTGVSTFQGVAIPFSFKVYRDDDPLPASGGGAGGGGAPSGAASTSTFAAPGTAVTAIELGRCAAVTTGAEGKVTVTCPLTYYAIYQRSSGPDDGVAGSSLIAGVEYSTNGGASFTAADGGHVGWPARNYYSSTSYPKGPRDEPASVNASVTITGLPSGTAVVVRVMGQWDGFGSGIGAVEGTLAAVPS